MKFFGAKVLENPRKFAELHGWRISDDKKPMTKELLQAMVATETRLSCIGRILKHFWADFRALADFI